MNTINKELTYTCILCNGKFDFGEGHDFFGKFKHGMALFICHECCGKVREEVVDEHN